MKVPSPPTFDLVPHWGELPAGMVHGDVADVAIDSHDNVYLIARHDERVIVCASDGRFLRSWGDGIFSPRPHAITIDSDDMVYCVDEGSHCVRKFTPEGEPVSVIGTGRPSDTGVNSNLGNLADRIASIQRGGPPFNLPTKVAVAPWGEIYVSDGYGNARVHRFAASLELIGSWGEPGTARGQFHVPHSVHVDPMGRVLVCDRENDRIQLFNREGEFTGQWTDLHQPTAVASGSDDLYYVAELGWPLGYHSFVHGLVGLVVPSQVSVLDGDGHVLRRLGGAEGCAPGNFVAAHGIAIDSQGDMYVAEVTWSYLKTASGGVPKGCHTIQKFRRASSVPRDFQSS